MASPDYRREALIATLDSTGWKIVEQEQIRQLRAWSQQLLDNDELPEAERRGLVRARHAVKAGLRLLYEKAGREMPAHLKQEIDFYSDEDV